MNHRTAICKSGSHLRPARQNHLRKRCHRLSRIHKLTELSLILSFLFPAFSTWISLCLLWRYLPRCIATTLHRIGTSGHSKLAQDQIKSAKSLQAGCNWYPNWLHDVHPTHFMEGLKFVHLPTHASCLTWDSLRGCASKEVSQLMDFGSMTWILLRYPHHTCKV